MSRPNVLVFGLGGIGGVYASILYASKECDVSVVARSNYDGVKNKGYTFKSNTLPGDENIQFHGGKS